MQSRAESWKMKLMGLLYHVALMATLLGMVYSGATYRGRMSTFGGPDDHGVEPDEKLALYSSVSQRPSLFLPYQPEGTSGLARRLNPDAYYIAMRWNYAETSKPYLRSITVTVRNPENGRVEQAYPADWGPHASKGRVADLSPGLADALGLNTDDVVEVTMP